MMKKVVIITVYIMAILLYGCQGKDEKAKEKNNYEMEKETMVASNETSEKIKLGIYYSKTTGAFFWIEDNQTLKYVDEGVSGSMKYGYYIEDNRLIATSWTKTIDFEILDDGGLKLGEDVFYIEET